MFEFSRGCVRRVRNGVLTGLVLLVVGAVGLTASAGAAPPQVRVGAKHGLVMARGYAHQKSGHGKLKLLTWHGGSVMTEGAVVEPIYWGPSWADSTFAGDKVSGLSTFYSGIGGSSYIGTNQEYTNDGTSTGTHVGLGVTYAGDVIDASATPTHGAPTPAEVLQVVSDNISSPVANGYYPVYSDIPRGHRSYCAWHSDGIANGVHVQFAFFFAVDGDPGCDPQSTIPTTTWSEGLQALANMSGHELSEALTDPSGTAWFDQQGMENADKCAWTFNGTETLSNGSTWYIQGNFSNAAATSSPPSGYDGGGCINGNP